MGNVLILKNKVKRVTTRGGKMTSKATLSIEIIETGTNKNEPLRFEQDVQENSHDDGVENKSSGTPERTTQPWVGDDEVIFDMDQSNIETKDKKGAENLAADHLSRLENPHMEVLTEREIADEFPDEHLMVLRSKFKYDEPWFGVPTALISDRGIHFCNSLHEKALQRYGVTHKLSTVYHPQSNGQTEVTNRAIKRILERSVGYNPRDWSKKLNDALWAFRTAYKTPTRCTPFRLVYGKTCHLPVEIEYKLNELAELRDGAYKNTRIYKEQPNKWHDSRLRGDREFKVFLYGDLAGKEIDNVGEVSIIWNSCS
ncbi:reverse transcriptase domain-containing protein [Tanacetum coccineum]